MGTTTEELPAANYGLDRLSKPGILYNNQDLDPMTSTMG